MIHQTTMEINGVEDVPVYVHYSAYRASGGATDGRHGPKIEPDEPAHLEIDYVELVNDDDRIFWLGKKRQIELTPDEQVRMEEEIGEALAEMEKSYQED